jgi:hypothetical protein
MEYRVKKFIHVLENEKKAERFSLTYLLICLRIIKINFAVYL